MSRLVFLMLLLVAYAASGSPECPVNSEWNVCGTLCEPTCADPNPNKLLCPAIECTPSFTGGCRCQKGYLRNSAKECVLPIRCHEQIKNE